MFMVFRYLMVLHGFWNHNDLGFFHSSEKYKFLKQEVNMFTKRTMVTFGKCFNALFVMLSSYIFRRMKAFDYVPNFIWMDEKV